MQNEKLPTVCFFSANYLEANINRMHTRSNKLTVMHFISQQWECKNYVDRLEISERGRQNPVNA